MYRNEVLPNIKERCAFWVIMFVGFGTGLWLSHPKISRADTGSESSPQQEFQNAKNAFTYGDYADAVRRFRQLLYPAPGRLNSPALRREAHKFLGISYYYLFLRTKLPQYRRSAERELTRFLVQSPDATLDPLYFPPNLINFFEEIRKTNKRRLELLLRKRQQRRNATRVQLIPLQMERHHHHYHPIIVAIPFGVPQFMNQHRVKGGLLLAGEIMGLGANIVAYSVIYALQIKEGDQRGRFKAQDIPIATRWQVVQFVSIGIFAGLVIYGMIDGAIYLPRRRVTVLPNLPTIDTREFSERSFSSSSSFSMPIR